MSDLSLAHGFMSHKIDRSYPAGAASRPPAFLLNPPLYWDFMFN
jgi:hypothetical protein